MRAFGIGLGLFVFALQGVAASGSYLGVAVLEVNSEIAKASGLKEERGVQVTQVDADSPASRAGLQVKDVVLEFNGQRVEGTAQFVRMVSETPVGRKATLGVFRNGGMQILTAQISQRPGNFDLYGHGMQIPPVPPAPPVPLAGAYFMSDIPVGLMSWRNSSLGYVSEPVDGQMAEFFGVKEGVLVRSVSANSAAEKAGLKAGDVITKAEGETVRNPRDITGILRRQRERKVSLTVVRAHRELTLELIAMAETKRETLVMQGRG